MVTYNSRYLHEPRRNFIFREPNLREIGARIRKERERNKTLHTVTKEEEKQFWKSYLQKYSFIINVHDYWNLLDFLYRLLGEPMSGEKILDAGCGIGNYGTFLFAKLIYRLRQSLMVPSNSMYFSYVGIDFVREAVLQARDGHYRVRAECTQGIGPLPKGHATSLSYLVVDLESKLPFEDNAFDKICCNLVISYLQDPEAVVAEMVRVLKPKGRIVVTSLKPFADLSEIYRNFLRVAETKQEIEEAYKLLSNAGRVKAKEAEGIYHFFSEEELTDILRTAGAREIETYRSFGNQANIAVGAKC
jgi:ubiquinone/menaquinone biosynthesis C-methylase UbiE